MDYSKFAEEAANRVGWWWLEQEKYGESDTAPKENDEMAAPDYSKSAEAAANKVGLWWLDEEKTNECAVEEGHEQMNKDFSMKNAGHFPDREVPHAKFLRVERKCPQQHLFDSSNSELFPKKKTAIEGSDGRPIPGVPYANLSWETTSSFQTVKSCAGTFSDSFYESELPSSINFGGSHMQSINAGNPDIERRGIVNQYATNTSTALSLTHNMEDNGSCLTYEGVGKVRFNQVKDTESGITMQLGNSFLRGNCRSISLNDLQEVPKTDRQHCVVKQCNYSVDEFQEACGTGMQSVRMSHVKDVSNILSNQLDNSFSIHSSSNVSFSNFPVEAEMRNYSMVTSQSSIQQSQSSIQHSEVLKEKEVTGTVSTDLVVNVNSGAVVSGKKSKSKNGTKVSKNLILNSFPSNVRCLLNTGILDGVSVKYVVGKNEELRGAIKNPGYLCGCTSCNYSKVLNAYEFEKHAGSKSKHPNNHIYFENGKTVYAVAQELKTVPTKMLFNAIESCTGSPINQKAFATWKESYMAASRELERIYGSDLLKLSTQSGD